MISPNLVYTILNLSHFVKSHYWRSWNYFILLPHPPTQRGLNLGDTPRPPPEGAKPPLDSPLSSCSILTPARGCAAPPPAAPRYPAHGASQGCRGGRASGPRPAAARERGGLPRRLR